MITVPKKMIKSLSNTTFSDLFCGIGAFRYALESFGGKCVFSSDINEQCQDIYEVNHGDRPSGDITKIPADDVPTHDVLCAGFPCQPFSISGKQQGFKDDKGVLFWEIHRISKVKRPKILLLENVRNLATHDEMRTITIIKNSLKEMGYRVFLSVLNSSEFGVPQHRERTFIVCLLDDVFHGATYVFPKPTMEDIRLHDIMVSPERARPYEIAHENFIRNIDLGIFPPHMGPVTKPIRIGEINKGRQGERVYHDGGPSITLSSGGGGVGAKTGLYLTNGVIRRLTPRECARLTGFPENFIMHESINQCHTQFGNSIVVDVLQRIIESLIEQQFLGDMT
jgi:DNA (cytosine-5)-methyltransferase 1